MPLKCYFSAHFAHNFSYALIIQLLIKEEQNVPWIIAKPHATFAIAHPSPSPLKPCGHIKELNGR